MTTTGPARLIDFLDPARLRKSENMTADLETVVINLRIQVEEAELAKENLLKEYKLAFKLWTFLVDADAGK